MTATARRRYFIGALTLIALAALWTLFGMLAVPRIVRSLAVGTVRERMHRELALGPVTFNPLKLELVLNDVKLPDAQGGTLIAVRRVDIDAELLRSLAMRGAVLAGLTIDGLDVQAAVGADGHLNLADLAQLKGPDDGDDSPARFAVDRLAVTSGTLAFRELDRPRPFVAKLTPLRFELQHFSTLGTQGNDYHFSALSDAGETLDWRGHLFLEPLRSDGQFLVGALQASTIASYLADALPFALTSGRVDVKGSYDLVAGDGPLKITATVNQLDVQDLGIRPPAASQDYVHLAQLRVSGVHADVAKRDATVEKVELTGGTVNAWRERDGALNLAALAGAPGKPATPAAATTPAPATATPAWTWQVADIAVSGIGIALEDRGVTPAAPLAIHDLALGIRNLSQDDAKPLGIDLQLGIGDSGHVASKGELVLRDAAYKGRLDITGLDLTPVQPYLQQETDMTLLSGRLAAGLDVTAGRAGLTARGDVVVRDLRTIDNVLKQDFVKWSSLQAKGLEFRSAPQRLRIRELVADAPYARVIVGGDRSLNISHVLRPAGAPVAIDDASPPSQVAQPTAPTTAPPATAPMDIAIDIVRINKASANFADLWIKPNFAVGILDLGGTVKGLSSKPDSRAVVDLKGSVDRYAPAVISGQVNPLSATVFSDIAMSFRNMDMTTVTPYSGRFAGYEIAKGKLSVELSYKIKDRKLDAGHHFVIDQLELGDRVESPDATSLPVRLAIALLKDRHGLIDVSLPVTGSLDDPQFRLAPLVWKAIFNLVVKAATAPFALLGSLFGGGEEVNQVNFVPGTAMLDDAGRQKLDSLRKMLIERPSLRLDVPAAFSAEVDRPAMLRRQLEAQLAAVAPKAGSDRYRQLVAAWRVEASDATLPALAAAFEADRRKAKDAQPPPEAIPQLEAALLERFVVGDEELADLGKQRAAAVQDVLFATQEVDPVRVFVVNGAPAKADAQQLQINLTLK